MTQTLLYVEDTGTSTRFGKFTLGKSYSVGFPPTVDPVIATFSLAADRRNAALIGDSREHPSEVFHYRHQTQELRRLTVSNPVLDEIRLAPQEVVKYPARDQLPIEGILIRPLDEKEGEPAPLIVVVHGGPEAHYSNGWVTSYSEPGQLAAARGFAVFYPNYRGSTGRGVRFSMADHGDPAGKEFDDIVDGVEHLVTLGLVDRSRVGVTGRSYGGYASAWCATALTEHFAAAVMGVGISDQISFAGTTDIPNEMTWVHFRKRAWEDWQLFLERSPIFHAEKSKTPLLILHGKDDSRVHPSQSLELYRYLKAHGKTAVRLVLYPGEGHGTRRAASKLDSHLRLMRWMEHYLKGSGGEPPPRVVDTDGALGSSG